MTVYQHRTCVPRVSPRNGLEAVERINRAILSDAEDTRVVRPEIDHIADYRQAREIQLAGSDRTPRALASTTAKRVSIDDAESAAS